MKRYLDHIKNTKAPHERRAHAVKVAGFVTAAVFVLWAGTLSLRLGSSIAPVADAGSDSNMTQNTAQAAPSTSLTASAAAVQDQNVAHLEISTTSIYSQ